MQVSIIASARRRVRYPLMRALMWAWGVMLWAFGASGAAAQTSATEISLDPMARHYQLGHGLAFGDSGFRLGGYGVVGARELNHGEAVPAAEARWQSAIETVSGFLWWESDSAWRFFSEVAVENVLTARPGEVTTADHIKPLLERFYVDYAWRDAISFRLGKFLTPIGRWNLIHAAPLVWTSSRPLITEDIFPGNATGVMTYGAFDSAWGDVEYSVWASPGVELARPHDRATFKEAYGGHVTLSPHVTVRLGLSFADFELADQQNQRRKLYGIDAQWLYRRIEISGEFASRVSRVDAGSIDGRGGYLQVVVPLSARWYGITRYERFDQAGIDRDLNLYVLGLTWRYRAALAIKGEWSGARPNNVGAAQGWRASVAVLF